MSMNRRPPSERAFIIRCIALKKDFSNKDMTGLSGMTDKDISRRLRDGSIDQEAFERLLLGVDATPGEAAAALACYEGLTPDPELTDDERTVIETEILERSRRDRLRDLPWR